MEVLALIKRLGKPFCLLPPTSGLNPILMASIHGEQPLFRVRVLVSRLVHLATRLAAVC